MLFAETTSFEQLLALLSNHTTALYPILFFGAFLETLLPCSFFIYGEAFFIAGAVLAGTGTLNIWTVAAVLFAGGILGDNASYWLGRRYGMGFIGRLGKTPFIHRLFSRSKQQEALTFFKRRGAAAVFWARLCGPFSWFMPFLAGAYRLPYSHFLPCNSLGVVIGIGEFLLVGYFFGNHLEHMTEWLTRLGYVPLAAFLCLALFTMWRRLRPNG